MLETLSFAQVMTGDIWSHAPDKKQTHIAVICSSSPGNAVVSVTPSFALHTGYTPAEVVGKNLSMLHGPETREADINMFRDAIAKQQAANIKILNYRKSGEPFLNHVELAPIFDNFGALRLFVGVQRAVSLPA